MSAPFRCIAVALALALGGCDPPPAETPRITDTGVPPARGFPDAGVPDRTVVRKTITYYHWLRTDPPAAGGDGQGTDHGRVSLTLVVEVHKNAQNEGWVTVSALGSQVSIPEVVHFQPEGSTVMWHLPSEGHNDPRTEIFGGEIRSDEVILAYFAAHPDATVSITPGAQPTPVRLPVSGHLAATPRASIGEFDAVVVCVIPVTTHRGGRYLVQLLDLLAEPGGFSANGVMNHVPTRSEIERYTRWLRAPAGSGRSLTPPIAIAPIDRT